MKIRPQNVRSDVGSLVLALVLAASAGSTAGCGAREPSDLVSASIIRLDFDASEPERLARYYLGGYLGPDAGDPFERGLAIERNGRIYLHLDTLHALYPPAVGNLQDSDRNNRLDWEELAAFFQTTYYDVRGVPASVDELRSAYDFSDDPEAWFRVEVDGVMTTARRRVHVSRAALREAVADYRLNDERLVYPRNTAFIGEHYVGDELRETTAMLKRADGFWDFATYDSTGALAGRTITPPRPLASPTQCVGCHFGSRRFEPEASFPAEARPGPHGPRVLHVDASLRIPDVVAFFDEHARRSDTVLGLYGTLFVAGLEAQRRAGTIGEEDSALLNALRLDL